MSRLGTVKPLVSSTCSRCGGTKDRRLLHCPNKLPAGLTLVKWGVTNQWNVKMCVKAVLTPSNCKSYPTEGAKSCLDPVARLMLGVLSRRERERERESDLSA